MQPIRIDAADGSRRTEIGPGLRRLAVIAGRIEVDGDRYYLTHGDGCSVCGAGIEPGRPLYFDPYSGAVFCPSRACGREAGRSPTMNG
ncbi:hypothetical protein BRD17_06680 [Halobacteriales archaeon SW_7_68_16]|nr:MAG: hypothetical protein BRD17_06680 [Halobacteriales archaeon SW_7_68_16]